MFCLNCDCEHIISLYRGRFCLPSAGFSSLYPEYCYIEDRYIGVLFHTFYCNFCRDIEYSSLYWKYRYIEDRYIRVPLYLSLIYVILDHGKAGVDPGVLLGGGAPLRNNVTDSDVNKCWNTEYWLYKKVMVYLEDCQQILRLLYETVQVPEH